MKSASVQFGLVLGVLLCAGAPLPATAQLSVYDPANHAQNILQAARALQQLDQQVEQLTHEIEMLENMARDLETFPIEVSQAIIQDRIARIGSLLQEAEGIGYDVNAVEQEYNTAYPETYGANPPSASALLRDARSQWEQSRTAHRDVLRMAAENSAANQTNAGALSELVNGSQQAAGNLQALQAGNQIDALSIEQLIRIEALMAAHYRAQSLDEARRLAEATRARARLNSFLEQ
nr:P-type conjugative transfer protein TrbJ [uncultured Hyphomonas sp.]